MFMRRMNWIHPILSLAALITVVSSCRSCDGSQQEIVPSEAFTSYAPTKFNPILERRAIRPSLNELEADLANGVPQQQITNIESQNSEGLDTGFLRRRLSDGGSRGLRTLLYQRLRRNFHLPVEFQGPLSITRRYKKGLSSILSRCCPFWKTSPTTDGFAEEVGTSTTRNAPILGTGRRYLQEYDNPGELLRSSLYAGGHFIRPYTMRLRWGK